MARDLAIDLGTANTLVYMEGRGIVINEPSVIAVNKRTGEVLATGQEAWSMIGRTPGYIVAVRPLRGGAITDFEITEKMIRLLLQRAGVSRFSRPKVLICVPSAITEVERRAVTDATRRAGAADAQLLEQPMAAAIGADLPINEPVGNLVIDIGGGTTETAVISLGGIVALEAVRVGSFDIDAAIQSYVRREHGLAIGERTAEEIKISIGSAMATSEDRDAEVRGRDLVSGLPKTVVLTSSEIVEFTTIDEAISFSTSGFALLVVDGCSRMLAIGAQGFSFRSVSEPESEVVQRGCREGFTEPLRINMTLIRRRIKSPDLVFETVTSGYSSNTQMMICYLQNSVSKQILKAIRERLENCNLKMILASGYLSSYLEDNNSKSLFSGVGISERPDTVCGKLSEGRVAILIDGTPSVIIITHLFAEEFQSVDDYSNRPYYAAFIRILKYISFLIAVFLPGIYTAFAQFHPEYFPTGLLVKTSDSLSQTPLPVTLEVILITFIYEVMREAGLRIPKPLGHAVSIVGALVIGESAVSAGIISSSTLMVVATAAICSYVTFALYPPIMVLRFFCVIAGGMFGLWGIVLLTCGVLVNMCSKTSIGVPYMSSFAPFSWRSMRDVFVRADWKRLSKHTIKVQKFPETEEM